MLNTPQLSVGLAAKLTLASHWPASLFTAMFAGAFTTGASWSSTSTLKLALAVLIILAGLVGYYYFTNTATLLRAFGVLISVIAALGVLYTSVQGQMLWKFIQGSRVELRKVVWPTREQLVTYTAVVIVFVTVLAGIVSAMDLGFTRLVLLVFG